MGLCSVSVQLCMLTDIFVLSDRQSSWSKMVFTFVLRPDDEMQGEKVFKDKPPQP